MSRSKYSSFVSLLAFSVLVTSADVYAQIKKHPQAGLTDKQPQSEYKAPEKSAEFDADAMVKVADNLTKSGNYTAALRVYRQIRDKDPQHVGAVMGQGEVFLLLGVGEEAERHFLMALDLLGGTENSDTKLTSMAAAGVARAITRQNRAAEALPYFEQVIAAGNADDQFLNYYGVTLDLLGRHKDAQEQYSRGLRLKPDDADLTYNLALSFALDENYEAAVRLLSTIVTAKPESEIARKNLVLVYGLSGDMSAAEGLAKSNQTTEKADADIRLVRQLVALPKKLRAEAIFIGTDHLPPPLAPLAQDTGNDLSNREMSETEDKLSEPEPEPKAVAEISETLAAVQVGSYPTESEAIRGWEAVEEKLFQISRSDITPVYWRIENRVRILIPISGGWGRARQLCENLKAIKVDCFTRRLPSIFQAAAKASPNQL